MKILIAGLGSIVRRHFRNLIALGEKDIVLLRTRKATIPDDELAGYPAAEVEDVRARARMCRERDAAGLDGDPAVGPDERPARAGTRSACRTCRSSGTCRSCRASRPARKLARLESRRAPFMDLDACVVGSVWFVCFVCSLCVGLRPPRVIII